MKPIIKNLEKIDVVGMDARFISAASPDANNLTVIPKLWGDYMKRSGEIKSRLSPVEFGVVICLDAKDKKSHPDEMLYIAGASVSDATEIPRGMVTAIVPAGKYAIFTHKGPVENVGHTVKNIFNSWLPASEQKLRNAPHLEMYDQRFNPRSADSEFDICVPVE